MPTSASNSGRGQKISLPTCLPSNRRSWRHEEAYHLLKHNSRDVLMRFDAGFGNDQNINWLLHRGYQVLSTGKSGKRAAAFARQVTPWQQLEEDTWIALAPRSLCHRYDRRTQTGMLRWDNQRSSQFKHALLICALMDDDLIQISQLYDDRASMENEIKADKAGLLLPRRRKKQLNAQEAFVLRTDLGHNIVAWTRHFWAAQPEIGDIGIYSIINKIMPIPGKVMFEDDQLVKVRLQATHPLAKPVLACLSRMLAEF